MNGLNLRCTTLCLPSRLASGKETMVEQKHPHRDDDHPRHAGRDHHHGSPPMIDHGGVGHFHHGGRGHVRAPASFGKPFSISMNTAMWPKEVYGYFGNSTGHVQETSGRVGGEQADRHWLEPSGLWSPGYPALAPYGAKKLVCGSSWCQRLDIG
jgi:hypothetical protein